MTKPRANWNTTVLGTGEVSTPDQRTIYTRWTLVKAPAPDKGDELVTFNSDITEHKAMEVALRRSQRMEGVGALACGIAHDFSNLLTPLKLSLGLLLRGAPSNSMGEELEAMESCVDRASGLIKQLLTFGRGTGGEREQLQLGPILTEIVCLAQKTFPKAIQLELHVTDNLWPVSGDSNQLYQALQNLTTNARDSLSADGQIRLSASNETIFDEDLLENPDWRVGDFVCIELSDTGRGIAPELQSRVFEPFYTTKLRKQGTGLGLSTALGLVKSHNGFIHLKSELGKGTSVHVYLPRSCESLAANQETTFRPRTPAPLALKGKRILLVDDENVIVSVLVKLLTRQGASVDTATNGTEALAIHQQKAESLDLVITDIDMPEMDGEELAQLIQASEHATPIIFITGIGDDQKVHRINEASGVAALLRKPFDNEELIQVARDVMAQNEDPEWPTVFLQKIDTLESHAVV